MKTRIIHSLPLLLFFFTLLTSCTQSRNYEKVYENLSTGMTQSEAETVMGTPPRKRESITVAGATMEKLTWTQRNEFYSATFAFGRLMFTEKGKK